MNPYASQTDGYNFEYESIVDSVKICNIKATFQKLVPLRQTDLDKPANTQFAKIIKKNWENKTDDNMKSITEKYKSPEKCVFAPLKVNLELWK